MVCLGSSQHIFEVPPVSMGRGSRMTHVLFPCGNSIEQLQDLSNFWDAIQASGESQDFSVVSARAAHSASSTRISKLLRDESTTIIANHPHNRQDGYRFGYVTPQFRTAVMVLRHEVEVAMKRMSRNFTSTMGGRKLRTPADTASTRSPPRQEWSQTCAKV